ncbi:MAG: Asp-tRNA(Asn)/Glu-tRNA(Gln) amidotransferase subunit GatB, partial [Rhodoplanes sp.]
MNEAVRSATKSKLIRGATGDWEVIVGMEVHAQVTSQAKLFSGASTEFGGEPNSHVSLVDAAMPGMLPVINEECVKQAIRTGLGLKAKINLKSVFDRKNYFYPDLPQGYQISQYKSPIVGEGEVIVDMPDGETVHVGIERLHLEQDAGKSLHDQHPAMSFVDLNRSGVALMEIVSRPDLRSADEAKAYVGKLRTIMRYLGTCDGDMEKGSLRADVNVSVRRPGEPLGTRCEIKNVNSLRFMGQAIDYEARRQIGILEDGGVIEQETRLFDAAKGETRSMRNKEEAHDYRYFPDPDLLPLEFDQPYVDALKADLPELPDEKKTRFMRDYGLSAYDADVLVAEKERADYYELMLREGADPKDAANWLINEYLGRASEHKIPKEVVKPEPDHDKSHEERPVRRVRISTRIILGPVGPRANAAILKMISSGEISRRMAKDLLELMIRGHSRPGHAPVDKSRIVLRFARRHGLKQVTDLGAIETIVDEIIAKNPDKVAQAKAKPTVIGWFVGQVMKASGGKANPQ